MMGASHAAVGVGSVSAMSALTTLLNGWHGLDADHASAAAWLITMAAGGLYAFVTWYIRWKYPTVPLPPEPQA